MNILKNTKIDFISKFKIATCISTFIILCGLFSLFIKGGPNLAIDFVGGTEIQIIFINENISIDKLRSTFKGTSFSNAEIIKFNLTGNEKIESEFRIKAKQSGNEKISEIINDSFQKDSFKIVSEEYVGAKVSSEQSNQALKAIILALFMLMIYIGFRFDKFYSFGSVVAVIHDVLFTLGIFSILNLEINLSIVAAFLTIVGYSLNDTIVIFDRIRENTKADLKMSLNEITNFSLNQTLSRTIVTSLTTLIVVIILYFLGGYVIKYFAFALIIGVLVGTYSSIFIASSFMLYFKSKYYVEEE